jgi:hypothetical protein
LKHPIETIIVSKLPSEPNLKATEKIKAPTKINKSKIDNPIKDGFVFKNLG